ncbi:CDK-activating kinase assembly factor MAT1 [Linum perenne]
MGVGNNNPKEIAIRRKVSSIYNSREEDFSSLLEYNDYLERVEDMVMNLVSGVDTQAIEAEIAQYQKDNAEQIMLNQAKKAEEYAAALAASKGVPQQTDTDLINPCLFLLLPSPYQVSSVSCVQNSHGIETGGQYAPIMATGQPRPMGPPGSIGGEFEGYDDEEMMRLRAERGSRAGGWTVELSKKRSLEEAFSTIWI